MTNYLIKRLLRGFISLIIVVAIVMTIIYSAMDRNLIFANDNTYSHQKNNSKEVYKYYKWQEYGYLDYITYSDYLLELTNNGTITEKTRKRVVGIGKTSEADTEIVKKYIDEFFKYYQSLGYTIIRLDAVMINAKKVANGGQAKLFAYKEVSLLKRIWKYFTNIIEIDSVNKIENISGDRGLTFTIHDPIYGGDKLAPAIIGNGTKHKYLLYLNSKFPYIHQNVITINLGTSFSVNEGVDVFETMNSQQGSYTKSVIIYPTGKEEDSADDLHTATYVNGSLNSSLFYETRFTDNYTNVKTHKSTLSKVGFSFSIGIIASILAYLLGVPVGIMMSRKKDKLVDKIGTFYIVFIIAVPSLAYIFLFKSVGGSAGLPTTFNLESTNKLMYLLPIISLALPQIATLMKWIRRFMIDQTNSDYVKFARSGGLSESEIFSKHILKNAAIPIIHGIPATMLFAMTGAIITERVYVVPGAGNLLTEAIGKYDNGVIVGVTLFYAVLSILATILGDVLISMADPRISFSSKGR